MGSFLALLFEFSSSPNYNFVMENFEIVYLSSLLNEKAGDFIQDELKKYGYPELKMAHGDIFHVLFEAGASGNFLCTQFPSLKQHMKNISMGHFQFRVPVLFQFVLNKVSGFFASRRICI